MGSGIYSSTVRYSRLKDEGVDYSTMTSAEAFPQRNINSKMSPFNVNIRESRDSEDHPESLAIILALDVTGSMGSIPHFLVKEGLPDIMDGIIKKGVLDPQMLFLGIGDHECDRSPLQVGQFESSDELLDKWLTDIWLEGGGGGNYGESYLLAWYFAAYHTETDCFEKRNKKGFLFTIGDEPVLRDLPKKTVEYIMGDGQYENFTDQALYEKACEKYNVFHIHIKETGSGGRQTVMDGWRQLLSDNLIIAERKQDVAKIISDTVLSLSEKQDPTPKVNPDITEPVTPKQEEMIL